MYNNQIVFYLLTLFVIFGGGILDNKYINISNISFKFSIACSFIYFKS